MLKNSKVGELKKKIEKIQKPYYLADMCLISAKTRTKKSHASVPLKRNILWSKDEQSVEELEPPHGRDNPALQPDHE